MKEEPAIKRITANLPSDVLLRAQKITGEGITETLVKGLDLLCRSEALEIAKSLKGKLNLKQDGGRRVRPHR
jgi:hypothetical protein